MNDYSPPSPQIRVLPEGIANRIAAGEVVERPSSVVKELVENALDAGATRISVAIKRAGLDEIVVSDNGWGMSHEDLELAFRRHATSKIRDAEDLHHITHLGFRGEALPSIASVARVDVTSRRKDSSEGFHFAVHGGKAQEIEPAPREAGTTFRIRSLFYNVPARRKFLRSPATEYNHIVNTVRRYALAYPETAWMLTRDERTVWDLANCDLKTRIVQVFGEQWEENLLPVEYRLGDMFISGFIGGTELVKRSRGDQFLFINRRPIVSNSLHHAVTNGFGPLIGKGEYPFYLLLLRSDPEEYDVNIHPAKHEVKFRDERQAYRLVMQSVQAALAESVRKGESPVRFVNRPRDSETSSPAMKPGTGMHHMESLYGAPERNQTSQRELEDPSGVHDSHHGTITPGDKGSFHETVSSRPSGMDELSRESQGNSAESKGFPHPDKASPSRPPAGEKPLTPELADVWQLHKTYILSPVKSGLAIIDQHVAHERVLYERAMVSMKEKPWAGQRLLFPIEVILNPAESAVLEELQPQLARMGLEMEHVTDTKWQILTTPSGIRVSNESVLIREILADYMQSYEVSLDPEKRLAASFACKAAIKKGDTLTKEEMNTLIDHLFATKSPFTCPHGRPIVTVLSIDQINILFDRK